MSRNSLYLVIALLAVVLVAGVGYYIYQQNQQPGLEIKVDGNGIKVNGNG
jgi:Tfp pilus assembly protein PilO